MNVLGVYTGKTRADAIERVRAFAGDPIPYYNGEPGDEVPAASIDAAVRALEFLPDDAFPAPGPDGSICIDYGYRAGSGEFSSVWIEPDGTCAWSEVHGDDREFAGADALIAFLRGAQ